MGITNWSIRHSVTIFVLIICMVVTGWLSYTSLPREAEPDITIPMVMVSVPYFGVSPADMETLVTNPLEEELEKLKDVDNMTSTSSESMSFVTIEFKAGVDMDSALADVRARVDLARPELPSEAEDPIINELSFSEFPIMNITLSGRSGQIQLKRVAELLEDDINSIKGILDVRIVGGLEREIRAETDPELLDYYNVSFNEVIAAIRNENLNVPGGSIDVGEQSYLVRVPGEFGKVREIEDVVIREDEGRIIQVRDVATVIDGYEDQNSFSRIDDVQSVSVIVTRRAGENIIRITDELKALVAEYDSRFAGSVTYTVLDDVSDQIRTQLEELENNILTGLLLVLIVLLFFLSGWKRALLTIGATAALTVGTVFIGGLLGFDVNPWIPICVAMLVGFLYDKDGGLRTALFVGTAIPLSMLISFAVLGALGVTLNIVVLFSLVLSLGMLVDNAIVIVENIYRHMTLGKDRVTASMDGVAEVAWPVIASTATTVGAFIPMLFWTGIMGEFMKFLPLTVIVVLLASLFVALIINPVLCATMMKVDPDDLDPDALNDDYDETQNLPKNFVYSAYRGVLKLATQTIPGAFITIGIAFLILFATFAIFAANNAGVEFFPKTTPERIKVNVTLAEGSTVEASDRVVRRIEHWLEDKDIAKHVVAAVGAGNNAMASAGGGTGTSHQSRLSVEFVEPEDMKQSADEFILELRSFMETIPGAEFEIQSEEGGPPGGPPVNLEIIGEDYAKLQDLAAEAERYLAEVDGIVDLKSNFEAGRQELAVRIDREDAGRLGLSTAMIADTVRAAINGVEASKFRENDEEYDIVVQMPESRRSDLDDVRALWVKTPTGERVQLAEIADVQVQQGWGSISHLDSDRVITVSAEAKEGYNANEVLIAAQEAIAAAMTMPAGYDYQWTGQNEDQADAMAFLSNAMLAALFIIALVLITQFNSIIQPVIILFSVILSLIGVLGMLLIRDMPFGVIMTGIGVISLAGVVVNNAIVLVDYINQLRDRGYDMFEAVMTAGLVRFRPVLLTAITTVLSLMPTVLGVSLDAKEFKIIFGGTSVEMWGPMANAIVGGLVVATVLTLVVVPALYIAFEWTRLKFATVLASNLEEDSAAPDMAPSSSDGRRRTSPGMAPVHSRELDDPSFSNPTLPDTGGSHA